MSVESEYDIKHLGLEIEFHHEDGDNLSLSPETEDLYGTEKEKAKIFINNRDGGLYSSEDLLNLYLVKSGTKPEDHIPGGTTGHGGKKLAIWFPLNFPENGFHMITEEGAVDIKSLLLAVELQPKKH